MKGPEGSQRFLYYVNYLPEEERDISILYFSEKEIKILFACASPDHSTAQIKQH